MGNRSSSSRLRWKRYLPEGLGAEDRIRDIGDAKRLQTLLSHALPDDLPVISKVIERVLEIERREGESAALAAVERAIRALS
jgi:hypothetical protein